MTNSRFYEVPFCGGGEGGGGESEFVSEAKLDGFVRTRARSESVVVVHSSALWDGDTMSEIAVVDDGVN